MTAASLCVAPTVDPFVNCTHQPIGLACATIIVRTQAHMYIHKYIYMSVCACVGAYPLLPAAALHNFLLVNAYVNAVHDDLSLHFASKCRSVYNKLLYCVLSFFSSPTVRSFALSVAAARIFLMCGKYECLCFGCVVRPRVLFNCR